MTRIFQLTEYHRNVPDEELIADLRRVAITLEGKRLTQRAYKRLGKYSPTTITNRLGNWNTVLTRIGAPISKRHAIPDEVLFHNLVTVWQALGNQPRRTDMNCEGSRVSSSTYESRFGGWRRALEAFVEWANASDELYDLPRYEKPKSNRIKRDISWRCRARVLMRDGARCQLCGATPQKGATLHIDHVIPFSKGGGNEIENLQVLCEYCNLGKSDLQP